MAKAVDEVVEQGQPAEEQAKEPIIGIAEVDAPAIRPLTPQSSVTSTVSPATTLPSAPCRTTLPELPL